MRGRKNKYRSHVEPRFDTIQGLLRSGHTEKSIAKSLGVGVSSWERYKKEIKEFRELVKKSVTDSTALVVNAMHKRATGYEYEEVQITFTSPPQGRKGKQGQAAAQQRVIKKTTKHVSPDTAAGVYWTTNRDPEHWKNTQNIKHSGEIKNAGVLVVAPPMSKEEWLKQSQNAKSEEPAEPEKKKT